MDLLEFKQNFIEDALELLDNLDSILLKLEKDVTNQEHIEHVFRVMHTLKGTSGMYGFDLITDITHHLESLYALVREKKIIVNNQIIEVTFATVDLIRAILNQKENDKNDELETTCKKVNEKISQLTHNAGLHVNPKPVIKKVDDKEVKKRSWNIVFMPNETIITRNIKLIFTLQDLFQLGEYKISSDLTDEGREIWNIILVTDKPKEDIDDALIFVIDYCKITLIADFDVLDESELDERDNYIHQLSMDEFVVDTPESKIFDVKEDAIKTDIHAQIKHATNRITVDADKLDTLIYLVSELVTSKSELLLSIETDNTERTKAAAENIDKLSKLFRDNALSIRLVSLQDMLSRFRRLVRDLAKQLGKSVDFEVIGEDTELDKSIIEAISEPVMHLIRNCLDHGIETPAVRRAAGKDETGIIKFVAFKKGSFVFIQISDDGHGIDKQKILQKAIAKNLVAENSQLTDKEIYNLIFIPGFSTAESLTQVSGRGVGMDIVRKKIEEIRGDISIDSETGLGTSFTLKLQQTIAIIDTLLIGTENSKFAIPIEDIENCQLTASDDILKKHNKQLTYKDELIPYISLRNEFEYQSAIPEKQRVIVINKQEKRYAILTDEIIGEYQAVVKPLGKEFQQLDFLSGASILGDGSIALLLDTEKLKRSISN